MNDLYENIYHGEMVLASDVIYGIWLWRPGCDSVRVLSATNGREIDVWCFAETPTVGEALTHGQQRLARLREEAREEELGWS